MAILPSRKLAQTVDYFTSAQSMFMSALSLFCHGVVAIQSANIAQSDDRLVTSNKTLQLADQAGQGLNSQLTLGLSGEVTEADKNLVTLVSQWQRRFTDISQAQRCLADKLDQYQNPNVDPANQLSRQAEIWQDFVSLEQYWHEAFQELAAIQKFFGQEQTSALSA